ncbi:ORF6N domain-containing protein [Clostridium baratii]|uniref:ORF6N domain-containing protein n=1 Tax=Clostridium baratii TaxID=1561 RepID=UPI0030CC8693
MDNLVIKGQQKVMGINIPVMEGGFGEGQKVILVKNISELHNNRIDKINDLIKNNITKFNENELIDLKPLEGFRDFIKENKLLTSNRTKNIFLLSQRGYIKLVSMMDNDNDKKWDVMNNLIDDYFNMKAGLKGEQSKSISSALKQKEIETKNNNSFARVIESFNKALRNPNITKEAKKDLNNRLSQFLSGEVKGIKHLGRKTYSATEIGDKLGISKNKVGRLTEAHNLKTEEFGEFFKEVTSSGKEVPSFRYYDTIIPVLKGLLGGKQVKLDV